MDHTFFAGNRQALLNQLKKGALVVMTGYGEVQRSHDSAGRFEQEANFWYLTGVEQADWWLILDGTHNTQWLVAPDIDEVKQVFDGSADMEQVKAVSGIRTILSRDDAMRRLRDLAKHHSIVYTTEQPHYLKEHSHFQLNAAQANLQKILDRIFQNVQICNRELITLRTIKQPEEVVAIEKAIKVTIVAIEYMKKALPVAKYEYELQAVLDYEIKRQGATGHAYDPIVAHGLNACTLHYGQNMARMDKRSLVLLDVGARVGGYAADISRTYALGQPTKRQQAVHDAVREAQEACIELLKPGVLFKEYDEKCEQIMKQALEKLGLSTDRYREYFPHAMGHGLGVDVHDPMGGYDSLRPGMVMTVEPGIYIRDEAIGVRIEDDILITDTGHKNLSAALSTALR
jgi:Xaa-Pro aminopeptidase